MVSTAEIRDTMLQNVFGSVGRPNLLNAMRLLPFEFFAALVFIQPLSIDGFQKNACLRTERVYERGLVPISMRRRDDDEIPEAGDLVEKGFSFFYIQTPAFPTLSIVYPLILGVSTLIVSWQFAALASGTFGLFYLTSRNTVYEDDALYGLDDTVLVIDGASLLLSLVISNLWTKPSTNPANLGFLLALPFVLVVLIEVLSPTGDKLSPHDRLFEMWDDDFRNQRRK